MSSDRQQGVVDVLVESINGAIEKLEMTNSELLFGLTVIIKRASERHPDGFTGWIRRAREVYQGDESLSGYEAELGPVALEVALLLAVVGSYSIAEIDTESSEKAKQVSQSLMLDPRVLERARELAALRIADIANRHERDVNEAFDAAEAAAARLALWVAEASS